MKGSNGEAASDCGSAEEMKEGDREVGEGVGGRGEDTIPCRAPRLSYT